MKKLTKVTAILVMALVLATAILPAAGALAATNASTEWSQWPQQKIGQGNYDERYTMVIQRFLRERYTLSSSAMAIDGIFGSDTRSYVIRFQMDEGLTADGIVGSNTWNAMRNCLQQSPSGSSVAGNDDNIVMEDPNAVTFYFYVRVHPDMANQTPGGDVFQRTGTAWSVKTDSGWKGVYLLSEE